LTGSATVTVNTASTAFSTVSASAPAICMGAPATLSAAGGVAGTAAETKWYADGGGKSLLGTGETLTVSPVATTTYYVRREGTCGQTAWQPVTVQVVPAARQKPIAGAGNQPANRLNTAYAVPGTGATDFTWALSGGGTIAGGQGRESVQINWGNTPGIYQLSVTYGNGLSCSEQTSARTVVVYDAGAGFVTGGGWFDSPRNPARPYMQAAGKANFNIKAKYKQGDEVEGQTKLELKAGNLDFRSNAHDKMRLIVSGNTANYTGQGTINGKGQYGFLLAATDGKFQGRKEVDKLRMKIWDVATGKVVYDNQEGGGEAAAATAAISGGAITIHGAKDNGPLTDASNDPTGDTTHFTAYPNPFQDKAGIQFSFPRDENYAIDVFDTMGHLVKHLQTGTAYAHELVKAEWQPGKSSKGVFIIRITTDTGTLRIIRLIRN
jgi:hypothetical protein